ncbi:hypothetical protein D5F01_LYC15650 [Xyrichtys novacula]|uniref:Uncharacterized protein n=1 Tax=Xyrichtys novacula TaxID=13765 RepID=A0AAV1FAX1_XYRNO|nr:hypothetical protein D5F01_LYC15650 [Xyrichtys novacula]CAJ1058507.1 hypothetical protein D5F01_LYC15650 [Xyrichtys novacula]
MRNAVNLQHPAPSPEPHWEGSASHRRASIYIHSPLRSASGLLRLRSHDDDTLEHSQSKEQGQRRQPLYKCQSARSCSRPPVLDHITSSNPPSLAHCSLAAKLRFLSAPEDPGAAWRCGAFGKSTNQSWGRKTLSARRKRNHNKSTSVIFQLK